MPKIMPKSIKIFAFLLFLSGFSKNAAQSNPRCIDKERQALLEIKQGLDDRPNHLNSWNITNRDCCKWTGITCENRTGHVIKLDLRSPEGPDGITTIGGDISPSLVELKDLEYLDLSLISVHIIPGFIGTLSRLKYLNLSQGAFGEAIPAELGNLSRLEILDISYNHNNVYADNLEWLSKLSSLKFLVLGGINFTGSSDWLKVLKMLPSLTSLRLISCYFPDHIESSTLFSGNLSNSLEYVYMADNFFNPLISPWLFNLSSYLVNLTLTSNQLTIRIPDSFQNMSSLAHLDLSSNRLEGNIPKSLGSICNLKQLDISYNNLSVPLPDLLGNFSVCAKQSLEILILSNNNLNGSLQGITEFSSLKELYLDGNLIEGNLPESFTNLTKLEALKLGGNNISGVLSQTIGYASKLRLLDLSSNNLSGLISETHLSNLSNLQELDLSFNSLALNLSINWIPPFQLNTLKMRSCKIGPDFPSWLQFQNNISHLDISNSQISSDIPNWFWNLSPNLLHLNLSLNQIDSEIPDLPLKFKGFPVIDMSSNRFGGRIPRFFSNSSVLKISKNKFIGSIPFLCIKVRKGLSFLDLSDNLFSGELPNCFSHWDLLKVLNLANNNFSGKIPDSLGSLTSIQSLSLSNNSFSGILPFGLKNCTMLKLLDLGKNKLSGTIPFWLGETFSNLIVLRLRSNEFKGLIPLSICHLNSLRILDLSLNSLSGLIPSCLYNFTAMSQKGNSSDFTISSSYISQYFYWGDTGYGGAVNYYDDSASIVWKGVEQEYHKTLGLLRVIDLSSNELTGRIPEEITNLTELILLNLSRNSLNGNIPNNIGSLKVLESLDLSRNRLSGEIPDGLSKISSLSYLDLSNNNLSGKIPSGTQLQGFDASSYTGNLKLCGAPLNKTCPGDKAERERENKGDNGGIRVDRDEEGFERLYLYVGIAVGFLVGFWGFCGTLIFNSSWRYQYFKFWDSIVNAIYRK